MAEFKSFTYTGPEQEVRVGSETFRRFMLTSVSDADTIKELRTLPEFTEAGEAGNVTPAKPKGKAKSETPLVVEPTATK